MKKNSARFLFLSTLLFLNSCAFGTRNVQLVYPPNSSDVGVVQAAKSLTANTDGSKISLVRFVDNRAEGPLVGNVQNAMGTNTAKILAKNDVVEWVTNAIDVELRRSGFNVVRVSKREKAAKDSDMIVTGNLLHVYATASMSYEGVVSFIGKVEKNGKSVLDKPYTGQVHAGLNVAARGEKFAESLSQALSSTAMQFAADVNQLQ